MAINAIQYMYFRHTLNNSNILHYTGDDVLIVNNNNNIILDNNSSKSNSNGNGNSNGNSNGNGKNNNPLEYYVKGAFSGMFGILLSHPIDTIKTHVQTGNKLNTFKFGFRNLYKGISAPLLGVGFEKALVFGTYNYFQKQTISLLGNGAIPFSGAIAGFTASIIVSPYERLKILKQNSNTIKFKDLSFGFLFKGLSATFTREVPGFAIYFSVYEYLKYNTFTKYNNDINYISSFVYGGFSGITAWLFIYPQDRIKTILQSNSSGKISFTSVMKEIYAKGGIKHFYSGFSWAVARAMLLHSGTFCMMEVLNSGILDMDMLFANL
jgi:solute carrier family 25 (mitochondrial carnitine/acylcarnitine transporter), member 20/29